MGSEVRKVAAVSQVLEFRGLMGSDGSGTESCRKHVEPSSCHLGVGTIRLAMLCGE